jgi:hypothetical protein
MSKSMSIAATAASILGAVLMTSGAGAAAVTRQMGLDPAG